MNSSVDHLIAFLSNPKSYLEGTIGVQLKQTHASMIAICDSFVYKVKKPVNFEFLDFSTPEKRKFYCEEEIRLNKRLSAGIYLDILPIYKDSSGVLTFEGRGEEVDFAIKMHRMNDEGFLSFLIENDLDTELHYNLIVQRIADFYNGLQPQQLNRDYGTRNSISYIIDENQVVRKKFLDKTLHHLQETAIATYQADFLENNNERFEERVKGGWIRDVHGDLRLEHLHFDREHLNIYDCIEFKEQLRVNDVVNDLAFLSMELDYEGRTFESLDLFTRISKRIGDSPDNELWRFYKVHRACVRGMVHAVTGHEQEVSINDREWNKGKSKNLFGLATRYVVLKDRPTVIVLFGGTATGKSTIAAKLSELLYVPHLQSDVVRKELAGLKVDQYPDEQTRNWLYSDEMTKKTYEEIVSRAKEILTHDKAVIIDSRFTSLEQRDLINRNFKDVNIFWVKTISDLEQRKQRLLARENEQTISDARLEVFDQLLKTEDGLLDVADDQLITIDTGQPIEHCLSQLMGYLSLKGSS